MKSAFLSAAVLASAFALVSGPASAASEGSLLCHVKGVDDTINNVFFVNGDGEAERRYAEANGLAYELRAPSTREAIHPESHVWTTQSDIVGAYLEAQSGAQKVQGSIGGAFVYDIELKENADGTVAGKYVRGLLPDMVTCKLIQLDG